MSGIFVAENDFDIARAFVVLSELRTLLSQEQFLERVQRQREAGYFLACLETEAQQIVAVAGARLMDNLSNGRFLYVDDLATLHSHRSQRFGDQLFDWLCDFARENNCARLTLDSGVQRFAAHRFYLRKRMEIRAHHFQMDL